MATQTWASATSGDWITAGNWNSGVPSPTDSALISPTGADYTVTISSTDAVSVTSVDITSANATLQVSGGSLTEPSGGGLTLGAGVLSLLNAGSVSVSTSGTLSVGNVAAQSATVSVSGANSVLTDNGVADIGVSGTGFVQVGSAGTMSMAGANGITVGLSAGANGTLVITGANSLLNFASTAKGITDGNLGNGTVEVLNGGTITMNGSGGVAVASSAAITGLLEVSGAGSLLDIGATGKGIGVGQFSGASGTVEVLNGGTISLNGTNSTGGFGIGQSSGAIGLLTVSGISSLLTLTTPLGGINVGQAGNGTMQVQSGALVSVAGQGVGVGINSGGAGTLTVDGTGSELTTTGSLVVGNGGTAVMSLTNGASVSVTNQIRVGVASTSTVAAVTVDSSSLTTSGGVDLGSSGGRGTLTVQNGGVVTNSGSNGFNVGGSSNGSGTLIINGGTLTSTGGFFGVGNTAANGSLLIENAGLLVTGSSTNFADINAVTTATAVTASVVVNSGTWTSNGSILVGDDGTGTLDIKGTSGAIGVVNTGTNALDIGATKTGGSGTLTVESFGLLEAGSVTIAQTTSGTVASTGALSITGGTLEASTVQENGGGTISVTGGLLSASGGLSVANNGTGAALTMTGGSLSAASLTIASVLSATGSMTIGTGASATLTGGGFASVGSGGTLALSGGTISATSAAQNSGLITGFGVLGSGLNNNNSVVASGGVLDITGAVIGSGTLGINNASTLEIDGAAPGVATVAFNTGTETLILGTPGSGFSSAVTGLNNTDEIEFNFGNSISITNAVFSSGMITITESNSQTYALTNVTFAGAQTGLTFGKDNSTGNQYIQVLCFARGTRIATPGGAMAVEQLAEGDLVRTLDGSIEPIVWLGRGRVLVTPGRRSAATPVIVRKGALADGVPYRDLRVTKGHALYIDDMLIPVEFLVNHRSIVWDDRTREIEVYHIELARHAVLIADGAPAESYRDDGNRWLFHNVNPVWHLPPLPPCAPVLTGGPIVDAVWRRLLDRAGPRPELPTTEDPDLHLMVDGRRLDGRKQPNGAYAFRLTKRPTNVRIGSRSGSPEELGLARDPRVLGVALSQIVLWQGARPSVISAEDASLREGFHLYEAELGLRWTDGDAALPGALFAAVTGACEVELYVACTAYYPLFDEVPISVAA